MRTRLALLAPLLSALVALSVAAQPPKPVAAIEPLAVDPLPVVPKSSGAFVTLKVSDLLAQPDLKAALAQFVKHPDALAGVTELLGVSPLELDRVTLFWPQSTMTNPDDAMVVVTTKEPYNEVRVLKALRAQPVFDADRGHGRGHRHGGFGTGAAPKASVKVAEPDIKSIPEPSVKAPEPDLTRPKEQKEDSCAPAADTPGDPLFYEVDRGPFEALFLVDDRTMLFIPHSSEFAGMALLAATLKKNATGPLAEAIAEAGKHAFAAGVNLAPLFRLMERTPPELAPYTALFAARTAVVTGDLLGGAKLKLTLTFEDAAKAKRAAPVLEEGFAVVAEKLGAAAIDWKDSNRPSEKGLAPLGTLLAGALKKASVKAADATVVAHLEMDAGPAAAKALTDLVVAVQSRKKMEARTHNLKQIGLALHNYHDTFNRLPANVYGPNGEMLLSWRVQILPFLEEDNLYKQFKMDEAWDGPTNKALIERMPKVYQAPDREAVKGQTYYQGFISPSAKKPQPKGVFGNAWLREGDKNGISLVGIPDGTSNTLAVVEARSGVIWSKPDDLPFGGAVPALGEKGADRAPALRFDGSTMLFPNGLTAEQFWPYVTTNGGEVTVDPDDRPRGGGRGRADLPPDAPPTTATQPATKGSPK